MRCFCVCAVVCVLLLGALCPALAAPGRMIFAGCHPLEVGWAPGLFVANPDGSNPVRLFSSTGWANEQAGQPVCIRDPHWSPDGRKLAMTWGCQVAVLDLVSLLPRWQDWPEGTCEPDCCCPYAQGINLKPTIIGCGNSPRWSPAGDRIAFFDGSAFDDGGVAIVNPDGSDRRALAEPAAWDGLTWTGDGQGIVYASSYLSGDLYLVTDLDAPSPTITQLTSSAENEHYPAMSPDGAKLAFSYGPSVPPDYDEQSDPFPPAGIRVVDYPGFTNLRVLTDDPAYHDYVSDWTPDGEYIYFWRRFSGIPQDYPQSGTLWRVKADGSAPAERVPGLAGWDHVFGDVTFLSKGVYSTSTYSLPGYTDVPVKVGIVGAENVAGIQAVLTHRMQSPLIESCCPVVETVDSCSPGGMIADWQMVEPSIGQTLGKVRALAWASNPEFDAVSGSGELLDLRATVAPLRDAWFTGSARFAFTSLDLSDDWGDPIDIAAIPGGIGLKPFSYLAVSPVPPIVTGDAGNPEPFDLTIEARGDGDELLSTFEDEVFLYVQQMTNDGFGSYPMLHAWVTPTSVALTGGRWTGSVTMYEPMEPGACIVAKLRDWGGYSNEFHAVGKGDVGGDGSINIFDVVKIANIAIGRGTWEPWQLWAADLNADDSTNIFDVVLCARAALEAMAGTSTGREATEAASALTRAALAPGVAGPVAVTTSVADAGGKSIVSINLSNCSGVAGVQLQLNYDAKKLRAPAIAAGGLLAGRTDWSVIGNDLGGSIKAITYTPALATLSGGPGTILTIAFDKIGRGEAKVSLASVTLAGADGAEIPAVTKRQK